MGAHPLAFNAPLGEILLDESEQGNDGLHRSWIMLLPLGEYEHPKGTLKLNRMMLAEVKHNFDNRVRGVDIALDYDHKASDGDSRAFGWIEAVEFYDSGRAPLRSQPQESYPGGLWARVRWTTIGFNAIEGQIYRYISAEYRPEWTNPVNNKTYSNVLIGATLTNRPFMNHMPAVQLSEVSHTAWGDIDKSKLPDSAFLDPKRRRLPVYEGAGEIVNGRYSERGALNLNGVRAALAAVHGAHTGKAMAGLPAGIESKLSGWLDQYGGDGGDTSAGKSKSSKGMSMVRGTHLNQLLDDYGGEDGEDEETELDDSLDDEGEYNLEDDEADEGEEDDEEAEGESDADLEQLARELQGSTLSRNNGLSDRRSALAAAAGNAGRGSTSMGESNTQDASVLLAEATQLREKLAASEAARVALEASDREKSIKLYEQQLDQRIAEWKSPPDGEAGAMVPSTAFLEKYRTFMMTQGITLSEDQRGEFDELVRAAFNGAVELGQRSLAAADMESRITRGPGNTADDHRVFELMEQISSRDYGETYKSLQSKSAKGDEQAKAATRAIMAEAWKLAGWDAIKLGESVKQTHRNSQRQ